MGHVNLDDSGFEWVFEESESSLNKENPDLLLWQGVDHWLCEWNEEC